MPRTGLTAAEIKEKALNATTEKMRLEGFDKVRLTDIAKELGVSHAALYAHFKDKSALLDGVSERWLLAIDDDLEAICNKKADPVDKIQAWMLTLHRAKVAKVLHDPELYKAFDLSTQVTKPYAKKHMETIHDQLLRIVKEAIAKKKLKNADAVAMTKILSESMMAFHHPKLVSQHINEKRESLLKSVLEIVLKGLGLK